MPVYIEHPTTLSTQDRKDLETLYQEVDSRIIAPYNDVAELIGRTLADGSLVVARFNSRLLGAARLLQQPDWELRHLAVRTITRNRGVARRLLDICCDLAQANEQTLHLSAPAHCPFAQHQQQTRQILIRPLPSPKV